MKTTAAIGPLLLILTLVSCNETTTHASGGKKLSITKPANQTLTRGATNDIDIGIRRENFAGPIKVRFTTLPKGVNAVASMDIAAGQDKATYTLQAAIDAPLVGNFEAGVTVDGPEAMSASQTFLISVKDK